MPRHNDRPNAETEAPRLSNFANKTAKIVHHNSLFVAINQSVNTFSAAFAKDYGASLLASRRVDIVEGMVSSNLLSGNSLQTYHRNIWSATFLLQRPILPRLLKIKMGRIRMVGDSAPHISAVKPCSRPGLRKDHLWSVLQTGTPRTH